MTGMDGLDGYWMDNDGDYACFDGFLDGFGGGLGWLLDDLG